MPKLGTNTVIANGVLLNGDGHPCVLLNSDGPPCVLVNGDFHPSNNVHLRMHFLKGEIHI